MFLILLRYKQPLNVVDQHLVEHRQYLEAGYQKGYFIVSGPRNPRDGGVILSQLKDKQTITSVIHNDPFYLHGVADFEIIEFDPVKSHPDFTGFL